MRSAAAERRIDGGTRALDRWRFTFQNQNEIHQIAYAAVRRLAWTRVRVKLFRPMLLDGERRHHNGGNAGETEPVFALDALERLKDFVSDAEVDVKLHEGSTIVTGVDWKTRATFWSLIQFGHRLAHDECEEVGQLDRRRELEPFSERDRVSHASLNPPDGQVEVFCRPRHRISSA
jgi:hypothetical protein